MTAAELVVALNVPKSVLQRMLHQLCSVTGGVVAFGCNRERRYRLFSEADRKPAPDPDDIRIAQRITYPQYRYGSRA